MNNFKNLLSSKRKELKMTQKDLAEKLNVSDKTISKWETGSSYPEITLLTTIAKFLDLNINDLFGVEDMIVKKNNFEERESYDYGIINKFKNKMFLIIGLITISNIFLFGSSYVYGQTVSFLMAIVGFALYAFVFILFISTNVNFRSFYRNKFYTREYDFVYVKYTSISIIMFILLCIIAPILIYFSFATINIDSIMFCVSLLLIIAAVVAIIKIIYKSNYQIKNDIINKLLVIITLLVTISIVFNLIPQYLIPIIYLLVFLIIFRIKYINNK